MKLSFKSKKELKNGPEEKNESRMQWAEWLTLFLRSLTQLRKKQKRDNWNKDLKETVKMMRKTKQEKKQHVKEMFRSEPNLTSNSKRREKESKKNFKTTKNTFKW